VLERGLLDEKRLNAILQPEVLTSPQPMAGPG
jgi:hypothetical protein